MPISGRSARNEEEEENFEMEVLSSEGFDSDNSEDDPTYDDHVLDDDDDDVDDAQSKLTKLSIKSRPKSRDRTKSGADDNEVYDMEVISVPVLDQNDMKNFEQVQKLIDYGQVEKLKVEQCKVYLRKHGLRLTGKKDILIRRIKEHMEISNGGGERKYPPSSFVLNCKGDACLGDVVMFKQTVFEGYNIVSKSACGPPCGKRIVAGRIVNESYGAAKQQHTFTIEVLWSKGQKPLPPLHPLLIKGRNLYKLNTMRQRWEDEAERQRVLDEKHKRGSIARSNREARIQEKETKKMLRKENRANLKEGQNAHKQKKQNNQEPNLKIFGGLKGNAEHGKPRLQTNSHHELNIPTYNSQSANTSHVVHPTVQFSKPGGGSFGSHYGYLNNTSNGNTMSTYQIQQPQQDPRYQHCGEENSFPKSYPFGYRGMVPHAKPLHPVDSNRTISNGRYEQPPRKPRQKLCRYYPQGRCHYGNQCKFMHELKRHNC